MRGGRSASGGVVWALMAVVCAVGALVLARAEPGRAAGTVVSVIAAGTNGDERMELWAKVDTGPTFTTEKVAEWTVTRQLATYTWNPPTIVTAADVQVRFTNDSEAPPRDLRVDALVLDGQRYETEDPSVFSTGSYRAEDGCAPGNKSTEWLNCNGAFTYARTTSSATAVPTRSAHVLRLESFATLPSAAGYRTMELTHAGDGSDRRFVSTQEGQIWLIRPDGTVAPEPFLDLARARPTGRFSSSSAPFGGLTYFAFHPDYARFGRPGFGKLFTAHEEAPVAVADFDMGEVASLPATYTGVSHKVIAEWTVSNPLGKGADADRALRSSYREVLRLEFQDDRYNPHAIGEIAFNPYAKPGDADYGKLYLAVGDGNNGQTQAVAPWAQQITNPFGKILRIDPLAGPASAYTGPADNPFVGRPGAAPLVWAYGMRDPQNFAWGRDSEGAIHLVATDIGQEDIEELNVIVPGGNYGWDVYEGALEQNTANLVDPSGPLIGPSLVYGRALPSNQLATPPLPTGGATAIVAGVFYEGTRDPALRGQFIFGDLARGRFFHVPFDQLVHSATPVPFQELLVHVGGAEVGFAQLVHPSGNPPRSDTRFGVDEAGELYVLDKHDHVIRRLSER